MSSWVVRCAVCYQQLRSLGIPEDEATRQATRDADNVQNTAAHVAERGHNEWERADASDGGWILAPWESVGRYCGGGEYSGWPKDENDP